MAFEFKLPKRLPSWLQGVEDQGGSVELQLDADLGEDATFAVASTKKELKQLKKSGADIVYDERKGKLYLNGNGEAKGWGSKAIGGLIAKVKGKPQVSANDVTGFDRFVDQEGLEEFRQLREGLTLELRQTCLCRQRWTLKQASKRLKNMPANSTE